MSPRYAYTKPEIILLNALLKNNLNFITQFPILIKKYKKYVIVDFLIENKLVVEVDGIKHFKSKKRMIKDEIKDKALRSKGFVVLRFKDEEVINNIDQVINKIKEKLKSINK